MTTAVASAVSPQVALDREPSVQNMTDLVPAAFFAMSVIRLVSAENR